MKANLIIMAMLLSVTTYAQDTIHPNSYKEYDFAMYQLGVSYHYDIEYLLSRNRYLVITELTLHKAYLDYCYADSVEVSGWRFVHVEDFGGYASGYDEWQTWWRHKEPTFEGYVEWLSEMLKF